MKRHPARRDRFLLRLALSPARAVLPDEVMSDPAKEARARHLSQELRCMVCQNQSIDDSEAPLARDLRLLVRERIASGDSDAQVIDFLVARYGEFVLLEAAVRALRRCCSGSFRRWCCSAAGWCCGCRRGGENRAASEVPAKRCADTRGTGAARAA